LSKLEHKELLTYEELLRVIGIAVDLGVKKVRLTGGEPLARRNIDRFLGGLAKIDGLDDIRITTNGVFLEKYHQHLLNAGVRKLNISLDTLNPKRFKEITGFDEFDRVWQGIQQALHNDFSVVKVNMVAMRGVNDDEIVEFARLAMKYPLQMRYIEFMPIGNDKSWGKEKLISASEIKKRIETIGTLTPVSHQKMDGPARVYELEGAKGSIGFISPMSHKFCEKCNRLRLTSEGALRSCLLSDDETDLRQVLRNGGSDDDIKALIIKTIEGKPKGHYMDEDQSGCLGKMSRIGG
jgi:cyclic pyranopterin phosphate synthase